jgi:hypothetical protein
LKVLDIYAICTVQLWLGFAERCPCGCPILQATEADVTEREVAARAASRARAQAEAVRVVYYSFTAHC